MSCPEDHYQKLLNGQVQCSDKYRYESMCTFTCNDGFQMYNGTQEIALLSYECTISGAWDHMVIPECRRASCPSILEVSLDPGGLQLILDSRVLIWKNDFK